MFILNDDSVESSDVSFSHFTLQKFHHGDPTQYWYQKFLFLQ